MTVHELKTWPVYFQAIADGSKTFEYRVDDRGYQPGDQLLLREYQPYSGGSYTGQEITATIGFLLTLQAPYVVFSLLDVVPPKPLPRTQEQNIQFRKNWDERFERGSGS